MLDSQHVLDFPSFENFANLSSPPVCLGLGAKQKIKIN